jgi:hypothetical protein
MSPLQLFLSKHCEADQTAALPLSALLRGYLSSLDGTEAPKWRDRQYVRSVLARSFTVKLGELNILQVVGLRLKVVAPIAAPVQSEAARCLS